MIKINGRTLEEMFEEQIIRYEVTGRASVDGEIVNNLYVVKDKELDESYIYDSKRLHTLPFDIQQSIIMYILKDYHEKYGGDE